MRNTLKTLLPACAAALAGLLLTQCASTLAKDPSQVSRLFIGRTESLLVRVQPFDSTVKAELSRGGVDPVAFEQELGNELRYRFFLRRQEGALDSASAQAVLTVSVRHLQPGTGTYGTFGIFGASVERAGVVQRMEQTWRKPAKSNAPPALLARDLVRNLADDLMERIPNAKPPAKEPPPPLQLLR